MNFPKIELLTDEINPFYNPYNIFNNLDIPSYSNYNSESTKGLSSINISCLGESSSDSNEIGLFSINSEPILKNDFIDYNNNNLNSPTSDDLKKRLFNVRIMKRIRRNNKRDYPRKFDKDNIIRKIKVSYTKFIIDLINEVIKIILSKNNIYFNLKFYPLEYAYARNVKKDELINLKNLTIEEVIATPISKKYKTKDSNSNEETCKKIKKEIKLRHIADILDKNFLFFFEKIYIKNRINKCNLKEFGLIDLEIDLSKLELFEDLISKNKKHKNYKSYIRRMEICKKIFLEPNENLNKFKTRKARRYEK